MSKISQKRETKFQIESGKDLKRTTHVECSRQSQLPQEEQRWLSTTDDQKTPTGSGQHTPRQRIQLQRGSDNEEGRARMHKHSYRLTQSHDEIRKYLAQTPSPHASPPYPYRTIHDSAPEAAGDLVLPSAPLTHHAEMPKRSQIPIPRGRTTRYKYTNTRRFFRSKGHD